MTNSKLIEVIDTTGIGEARRTAAGLGEDLGLDEQTMGRMSIVVTELATNLIKHAKRGFIFLTAREADRELEILSLDQGPGISDIAQALTDGHSTTGTSGTGLGAVLRQADFFNVYSRPKSGTVVLARFGKRRDASDIGAVSAPIRGEQKNGDGWASISDNGTRTIMVVDGLGHGEPAHNAANEARRAFERSTGSPANRIGVVHEGLRHTRGAAVAIAELDPEAGEMKFAGVGNISVITVDPTARRSAVSVYGIVGHEMRTVREFTYPWSRESSIIMHSDGLTTRWDLDEYPALITRDPSVIAGVLWKDHRRQNDDATVVVARTR